MNKPDKGDIVFTLVALTISLGIVTGIYYLLALGGHPSAVWFFSDVLGIL